MIDNWIDIVILTIFVVSVALGMWRGLFSAILGILSIVVGVYTAIHFSAQFAVSLHPVFGNSPIVPLAANVMLFLIGFMAFSTLSFFVRKFLRKTDVGHFDTLGGGAFGLLRATILSALLVLMFAAVLPKTKVWASSHTVPYIGAVIKIAMKTPPLKSFQPLLSFDDGGRPLIKITSASAKRQQELLDAASKQIQTRDNEIDNVTRTLVEQTAPGQNSEELTKEALKNYETRKKLSPAQELLNWAEGTLCELQENKNCDSERK